MSVHEHLEEVRQLMRERSQGLTVYQLTDIKKAIFKLSEVVSEVVGEDTGELEKLRKERDRLHQQVRILEDHLREAREAREDMRRAILEQRQRPPAPDMYVGRGRYDAAVADRTLLMEKLREVWNLAHTLAEGLRLTQEYIGDKALPRRAGWSWYDALVKYHDALGVSPDNFIRLGYADKGVDEEVDDGESS